MSHHHKTCFLVATVTEAKPFFQDFKLEKKWDLSPIQFFESPNFDLLITGVGPILSSQACGIIAKESHQQWINLGVAGALNEELQFGDCVKINQCSLHMSQNPVQKNFDSIIFSEQGQKCLSSIFPIHDKNEKQKLQNQFDLIDMESYSIALAAKLHNKELIMEKAISDHADGVLKKDIVKNIPKLMTELVSHYNLNSKL